MSQRISILGPSAIDVTGSVLSHTSTFGIADILPVDSIITELTFNTSLAGTVKFKVLQPSANGGWNVISSITLNAVLGNNVFSVELGNLTAITVPKKSMLAVWSDTSTNGGANLRSTSTTYNLGYFPFASDATGNNITPSSTVLYQNGPSIQQKRVYEGSDIPDGVLVAETFPAAVRPSELISPTGTAPNWTYIIGGMTNNGTGLANAAYFFATTNSDRNTKVCKFKFNGVVGRFLFLSQPQPTGTSVDDGTICEINGTTNRLILYQMWGGSTTFPAVRSTNALGFSIAADTEYTLTMEKDVFTCIFTLTDGVNSQTVTVENSSAGNGLCGRLYGRAGVAVAEGSVTVTQVNHYLEEGDCKIGSFGNSIAQGSGSTAEGNYGQLMLNHFNGLGLYNGDGGTRTTSILRQMLHATRYSIFKYVVFEGGTNNVTAGGTAIDDYRAEVREAKARLTQMGIVPVIMPILPRNDASNVTTYNLNQEIINEGWRLLRVDLALSLNNDGLTFNSALFDDAYHPNNLGAIEIFKRAQIDFPEIFSEDQSNPIVYTNFCVRSGGSNNNAGTLDGSLTEPGVLASFTYTGGTWVQSTKVFTVASGNPLTDGVQIGMFANLDGVFIGRITAVNSSTITIHATVNIGTNPANGTRTLRVGGALAPPTGATLGFITSITSGLTNITSNPPRINYKNDIIYDPTVSIALSQSGVYHEGYSSSYGDNGVTLIQGPTTGVSYVGLNITGNDIHVSNLEVANNGLTGSANGVTTSGLRIRLQNINVHDVRGYGIANTEITNVIESCLAESCNQSSAVNFGGFLASAGTYNRCISRNNTGNGFYTNGSTLAIFNSCISNENTINGLMLGAASTSHILLNKFDFYKNGNNGLDIGATGSTGLLTIQNSNFVANLNFGIGISGSFVAIPINMRNCGLGSNVEDNMESSLSRVDQINSVIYADDTTPWNDPDNNDFRLTLLSAIGTGFGQYTTGEATVSYPDIGSVESAQPTIPPPEQVAEDFPYGYALFPSLGTLTTLLPTPNLPGEITGLVYCYQEGVPVRARLFAPPLGSTGLGIPFEVIEATSDETFYAMLPGLIIGALYYLKLGEGDEVLVRVPEPEDDAETVLLDSITGYVLS